jgi:hypothetical protein
MAITQQELSQAYADYREIREHDAKLQSIEDMFSLHVHDLLGFKTVNNGSFGLLLNHKSSDIDLAIGVPDSQRGRVIEVLEKIGKHKGARQSTHDSYRDVFHFEREGFEIDLGVMSLRDYQWTLDGMNACRSGMTEADRVMHLWVKRKLLAVGRYDEYAIYKLGPYKKYFNENFIFVAINS